MFMSNEDISSSKKKKRSNIPLELFKMSHLYSVLYFVLKIRSLLCFGIKYALQLANKFKNTLSLTGAPK